ncbi:unnamed protein product, partial [Symbiodinium pilosum]
PQLTALKRLMRLSSPKRCALGTNESLCEGLGTHDFDDVSDHGPPPDEADPEDMELDNILPQSDDEGDGHPDRSLPQRQGVPPDVRGSTLAVDESIRSLPREESWQSEVPTSFWASEPNPKWESAHRTVELAFTLPETKNKLQQFSRDPLQFFIKSLRRKSVEISERRMTEDEKIGFKQAKHVEVKKYLTAKALEALPASMRPDRSQALRMRWILTYKTDETTGEKKPKARAVLLGYMDPEYSNRPTFAPTMTRTSRQLLLQLCAWQGMTCWKGDVSGAFLQGRPYERELHVIPVPELCEGLGLPPESVCLLRKACYGLVEAPIEWFETVNTFLHSIGYRQLRSDPCTWIYTQDDTVISIISGHVDDFLFTGRQNCPIWCDLQKKIQAQFDWQVWEKDNFTQCGVSVSRREDGSFDLSQKSYVEGIPEITISRDRRRQKHEPTTEAEKSQLRGLLGALSWHVGQVGYKFSAHVSLGLSARAAIDAEDNLYLLRYAWAEFNGHQVDAWHPEELVSKEGMQELKTLMSMQLCTEVMSGHCAGIPAL